MRCLVLETPILIVYLFLLAYQFGGFLLFLILLFQVTNTRYGTQITIAILLLKLDDLLLVLSLHGQHCAGNPASKENNQSDDKQ